MLARGSSKCASCVPLCMTIAEQACGRGWLGRLGRAKSPVASSQPRLNSFSAFVPILLDLLVLISLAASAGPSAVGRWPRCPSRISSTRARRTTSPSSESSFSCPSGCRAGGSLLPLPLLSPPCLTPIIATVAHRDLSLTFVLSFTSPRTSLRGDALLNTPRLNKVRLSSLACGEARAGFRQGDISLGRKGRDDRRQVHARGLTFCYPFPAQGAAFTREERSIFGLEGMLPYEVRSTNSLRRRSGDSARRQPTARVPCRHGQL